MKYYYTGFTLIEVLVALVILSIAFTAIFTSLTANIRNLVYLKNKTAADFIAQNVIAKAQLGLLGLASNNSTLSRSEIFFDQQWVWIARSQPINPAMMRVNVRVRPAGSSIDIIDLSGYVTQ